MEIHTSTKTISNLILSRREHPFVGWAAIDEFENLFSSLDTSRIAVPKSRRPLPSLLSKIRNRSIGPFGPLTQIEGAGDILLVVARTPSDLRMLYSVPHARQRFRYIVGYVIDSYFTEDFGTEIKEYDHIFSTTEEGAGVSRDRFGISSSVLRQGFDCLQWACNDDARSIDLIGFGRQPHSYHHEFQQAFHRQPSPILYLHSPIGTTVGTAVWDERPMLLKLMQRSKLSLAFHLCVEPQGARPRAANFVTSRWLESLATGCVVVGKRPQGTMADEMLCWPNAYIDLPDNPAEATSVIRELISDSKFLRSTRVTNVTEMCRRHDWRYRMRDIYQHFNLPLPLRLTEELRLLQLLVERLQLQVQGDALLSSSTDKG